jgi:hypothetical protein
VRNNVFRFAVAKRACVELSELLGRWTGLWGHLNENFWIQLDGQGPQETVQTGSVLKFIAEASQPKTISFGTDRQTSPSNSDRSRRSTLYRAL